MKAIDFQIHQHIQKWVNLALSTEPINRDHALEIRNFFCKRLKCGKPPLVFTKGPIESLDIIGECNPVYCLYDEKALHKVWSSMILSYNKIIHIDYPGYSYVRSRAIAPMSTISFFIKKVLWEKFPNTKTIRDWGWPVLEGQFSSPTIAAHEYIRENYPDDAKYPPSYEILLKAVGFGMIYLCREACIFSERFSGVNLDQRGRLHNEDGPAISYNDGFTIYSIHGINVPEKLVMTPADQLDPHMILEERNAEVRMAMVRKIGIEKVVKTLATKVLDSLGLYDLVTLDLGDGRARPYLKMLNPSTGDYHIEGVHPRCLSVKQALAWRNGLETYTPPVILT